MAITTPKITAEDLLLMPDDGWRYELVRGELQKMPPAGAEHSNLGVKFTTYLNLFVVQNDLGLVFGADGGFIIARDPDTVRAPDAAFASKARVQQVRDRRGYWPGPPDLALEVLSPGDTYTEIREKALEWLAAGCRMVVVQDPRKRTITVYRSPEDIITLTEGDTLDGGDVVPGWSVAVKELFG